MDSPREHELEESKLNTEPDETAEENPEKKIEIERIPEPMFPGIRERLSVVRRDESSPDDTEEQN
jgi:hypothetical protein